MKGFIKIFQSILAAALVLLSSCSGRTEGCRISLTSTAEPYGIALFETLDGTLIDSVGIGSGNVEFEVSGSIAEPYLCMIRLVNPDDAEDTVDIPVGIENGDVRISYGETFRTGGTPLNESVMVFFSGLSQLRDRVTSPDTEVAIADIPAEFSHYYLGAISYNAGNPLGEYILDRYGSHLLGDDMEKASKVLKK